MIVLKQSCFSLVRFNTPRNARTSSLHKLTCQARDGFIHHPLLLCPAFHLNGLCIFTTGPTSASWRGERAHTRAHTHTHTCAVKALAELDLQPGPITCDLAPLKLVTNSILGQLIRHAWALGFLYVVIKGRVYGRPRALGVNDRPDLQWTKSHTRLGRDGMCRQGYSHKNSLWYTEGRWLGCIGKWFRLGFTVALF